MLASVCRIQISILDDVIGLGPGRTCLSILLEFTSSRKVPFGDHDETIESFR